MTQEEFDNYRFSVNTMVNYCGEMIRITEVNFGERWVGIKSGQIISYHEIKKIEENENTL